MIRYYDRQTARPRTPSSPTHKHTQKVPLWLCKSDCPACMQTETPQLPLKTFLVNMSGMCVCETVKHKQTHTKPPHKHLHTVITHRSGLFSHVSDNSH